MTRKTTLFGLATIPNPAREFLIASQKTATISFAFPERATAIADVAALHAVVSNSFARPPAEERHPKAPQRHLAFRRFTASAAGIDDPVEIDADCVEIHGNATAHQAARLMSDGAKKGSDVLAVASDIIPIARIPMSEQLYARWRREMILLMPERFPHDVIGKVEEGDVLSRFFAGVKSNESAKTGFVLCEVDLVWDPDMKDFVADAIRPQPGAAALQLAEIETETSRQVAGTALAVQKTRKPDIDAWCQQAGLKETVQLTPQSRS